jgi:hypothetical protein
MSPPGTHVLTAVVVMPRAFDELAAMLSHLAKQTLASRLEVVLVHTPAGRSTIDAAAFAGFGAFKMVEVPSVPTVATGFVAGAAKATAPVVALVEDHVFLDPLWAEWVCQAHLTPCAAVAPRMRNGNPITATSWANFLICFGEAFGIDSTGPVDCGPGHNTSYKRAVLEHYAGELERLYQSERMFHYRLRGDGHTILAEPRAELAHVNISILHEAVAHAFLGGVLFGEYRAQAMGTAEKIARSGMAPLVPLLRLWRLLTTAGYRRIADNGSPPRALVLLPLLLVGHAAGEVAGYWRLVRGIEARYEHFELHRIACLRPGEEALLLNPPA